MKNKISIQMGFALLLLSFVNNSFSQDVVKNYFDDIIANYKYQTGLVNAVSLNVVVNNVKGTGGWKVAQADGGAFLLISDTTSKARYKRENPLMGTGKGISTVFTYKAETEYSFTGAKFNGYNTTRTDIILQEPMKRFGSTSTTLKLFTTSAPNWIVTNVAKIGNSLFGEINNGDMTFIITAKIITYQIGK